MPEKKKPTPNVGGDYIVANIGANSGQVAVGKNIHQVQQVGSGNQVTEADLKQVQQLFAELKQQIELSAPPEKKDAALERVTELHEEITSQKPALSTFEYLRNWFLKNVPSLAGAVASVVLNPIVGKVVEAAGTIAANQLKNLFEA
jgi:hypothetical protein